MTLLVGSILHMTRKIVSEMTYNVSMGTLNPTIPYHTIHTHGEVKNFGIVRCRIHYCDAKLLKSVEIYQSY